MTESIYGDKLVTITDKEIIFHHYYFPTGKNKVVGIDQIERILVRKPTLRNGKWRIHGTGDFKTWFPMDKNRPRRDRIFIAILKNKWMNIGFTVEDGNKVENFFKSRNLIEEK